MLLASRQRPFNKHLLQYHKASCDVPLLKLPPPRNYYSRHLKYHLMETITRLIEVQLWEFRTRNLIQGLTQAVPQRSLAASRRRLLLPGYEGAQRPHKHKEPTVYVVFWAVMQGMITKRSKGVLLRRLWGSDFLVLGSAGEGLSNCWG